MRRADNLTTFMCRLSRNLGASTSWNPQGLSRPVMGLLYLYLYHEPENLLPVCNFTRKNLHVVRHFAVLSRRALV